MSLIQYGFLSLTLNNAGGISTGTGGAIEFTSYSVIDTAMANSDTMEVVCERTSATRREIILITKVSNGNYTITTRGLYGTTEQAHAQSTEVTNDDTPGYYNGLRDATAFPAGTASVGIPAAKMKLEPFTAHSATLGGFSGTPTQANYYYRIGDLVHIYFDIQGTSNGTNFTATLPVAAKYTQQHANGRYVDNGSYGAGPPLISTTAASTTVTFNTSLAGGGWTGSAGKQVQCSLTYQANS